MEQYEVMDVDEETAGADGPGPQRCKFTWLLWDSICLPRCCLSVLQITFLDGVHFVHNHVTHVVHLFLCLQSEYPFYSWYWQ